MAKHIRRFSTYDEYLSYISDSSFEPPLVSVCDEQTLDNGGSPNVNYTPNFPEIYISVPSAEYHGCIYVTDEHEVKYTYNIGAELLVSKDNHILGDGPIYNNVVTPIPYHKDLYYCWSIWALGASASCSIKYYNSDAYENEAEINVDDSNNAVVKYFWNDYCSINSLNNWECPYDTAGFPENYNYPTITTYAYETNAYTGDAYIYTPDWNIKEGDPVILPIYYGAKLLPNTRLYAHEIMPK